MSMMLLPQLFGMGVAEDETHLQTIWLCVHVCASSFEFDHSPSPQKK